MQTSSFCFYTMLILFAWTGIITAAQGQGTDLLGGGLAGLRHRLDELDDDKKQNLGYMLMTYLPMNINDEYLDKLINNTIGIEGLYDIDNRDGFDDDSEIAMDNKLQAGVNAFRNGTPADKNAFTGMAKAFCDEFHGLIKGFVDACQSPDENGVVLKHVDVPKLNIINASLLGIIGKDDGIMNAFGNAYDAITEALDIMARDPADKTPAGMVEQFRVLLETIKPHMVFFFNLHSAICEKKDENAHKEAVKKRVSALDELLNNLAEHINKQEVEEEHFVATAKQIVTFINDVRMSIRIVIQNKDILAIRYAEIARVHADTKLIESIQADEKKRTAGTKQDYNTMKGDAKSGLNLHFFITPQKIASAGASGSSSSSGTPATATPGGPPPATGAKDSKPAAGKAQTTTSTTSTDESKPWYKKTWPWVVIIGVVVLAAVLGLLAAILFRKK